ncbi:MAG: 1-deoxy-D-xylulose-5-phosphate reductoisomerase [Planctomycetes bacterium]|nr:1-deoxy-D-xylulose-5-phosphate reductoisomerase [Planctomycetota bacterium]
MLGSTGSIGTQALAVVEEHPEEFRVCGLAARSSWRALARQVRSHRPPVAALADPAAAAALSREIAGVGTEVLSGEEGVCEVAGRPGTDVVVQAMAGAAGLPASVAALERGGLLALANKESMVLAGSVLLGIAARTGARIVPVDSEHSGVFQVLQSSRREDLSRVVLTASGGPFRDVPAFLFDVLAARHAFPHPSWRMGERMTIDSATLMNKAFEVVEARWFFDLAPERIEVVVHPESVVHSMVEFHDGSVLAQLGWPDMRVPIRYALSFPRRFASEAPHFDPSRLGRLTFEAPDPERFPALSLGFRVAREGGTLGAVLTAANEEAVGLFLAGRIPFPKIARLVETVLSRHVSFKEPGLAEIRRADRWAREEIAACSA